MKVIFLDVDGVLNNSETFSARKREPLPRNHAIDRALVARLNRIVDATGAVCVLSSSWRYGFEAPAFEEMLRGFGFTGRVIDRTPLGMDMPSGLTLAHERGTEIGEWLLHHDDVESFVILDDGTDMGGLSHRLINTDFEHGLTDFHVEQAIAGLGISP